MKRSSTLILRCAVIFAGIVVLAVCVVMAWITFTEGISAVEYQVDRSLLILVIGVCAAAVPFFIALCQALKLLRYIDTNRAFTELSVKALLVIMRCAIADFLVCLLGGTPLLWALGRSDGNPGMAFLGLIPAGVAFLIAVFTYILKRLLSDAIAAKAENDLTI